MRPLLRCSGARGHSHGIAMALARAGRRTGCRSIEVLRTPVIAQRRPVFGRCASRSQQPCRAAVSVATTDTAEHNTQQAAPTTSSAAQPAAGSFNWSKAWYPVCVASQLDKEKPQAFTLLGQPLVIWWEATSNRWVVQADRCPHRLAPLSEGRLTGAGTVMCSYHGWTFDASGSCTNIPQIGDPAAAATATSSRRSCVATHPCQLTAGLLWVWGDTSPAAAQESAAAEVALGPCHEEGWTMLGGDWFQRDVLYSYDVALENLFDPSHIPFAHHKIMGSATRDKAIPLNITTLKDVALQGFQLTRDSAPFATAVPSTSINDFVPPTLCSSIQTQPSGRALALQFYAVPTMPGRCRIIAGFLTNARIPPVAAKLSALLEPLFHCGQNQVLDSDGMILHVQERMLHQAQAAQQQQRQQEQQPPPAEGSAWRSAFYLPANADLGIVKFRTWYEQEGGGHIPWPAGVSSDPGPVLPRTTVLDRYGQHVAGCKSCSKALAWAQRLQAVCLGAAVVAAAVAAAQATWQLQASSAAAAAAAAATGGGAAGATAASAVLWPAAAAAAVAALLLLAYAGLQRLVARFTFVDYVHANVE